MPRLEAIGQVKHRQTATSGAGRFHSIVQCAVARRLSHAALSEFACQVSPSVSTSILLWAQSIAKNRCRKIKSGKIKSGKIRIEHHELLALSGNLQPLESSPQSVFQWLSRAIVKSHTWSKIGTRTLRGTDVGVTIASHGSLSTMMMGAA